MLTKLKMILLGMIASIFLLTPTVYAGLINGSFEDPRFSPGVASVHFPVESSVLGWETTATDNVIEIWTDGFGGVTSFEGFQHAELNATQISTLFQGASGIAAGSTVGFEFAHRGRAGLDTMRLTITDLGLDNIVGGVADTILFTKDYSADDTAWVFNTSAGEAAIVALGNTVSFSYAAVSAAGGSTVGNFLDAVDFGVGVGTPIPEPSTMLLFGTGVLGLIGYARRRQKTKA